MLQMQKHESIIDQIVSKNVIRLREERGWSQEDLAKKYGCTFQYVSQMETGRRGFGKNTFNKLMRAFGVTEKELLEMPKGLDTKNLGEAWESFCKLKTGPDNKLFDRVMNVFKGGDPGALKALDGILSVLESQKKESPHD